VESTPHLNEDRRPESLSKGNWDHFRYQPRSERRAWLDKTKAFVIRIVQGRSSRLRHSSTTTMASRPRQAVLPEERPHRAKKPAMRTGYSLTIAAGTPGGEWPPKTPLSCRRAATRTTMRGRGSFRALLMANCPQDEPSPRSAQRESNVIGGHKTFVTGCSKRERGSRWIRNYHYLIDAVAVTILRSGHLLRSAEAGAGAASEFAKWRSCTQSRVNAKAGELMYRAYISEGLDTPVGLLQGGWIPPDPGRPNEKSQRCAAGSNINLSFASELRDHRNFR
jgi:hypothetical protein